MQHCVQRRIDQDMIDPEGNHGKTVLAKYLIDFHGAIVMSERGTVFTKIPTNFMFGRVHQTNTEKRPKRLTRRTIRRSLQICLNVSHGGVIKSHNLTLQSRGRNPSSKNPLHKMCHWSDLRTPGKKGRRSSSDYQYPAQTTSKRKHNGHT